MIGAIARLKALSARDLRLAMSVFTSVLAKFVGIGATLVTIPLTLDYLGEEKFTIWMVISGFLGFLTFSDFGLGMGLQNALSRSYGLNDKKSQPFFIATGYMLVTILVLVLSGVFAGLLPYVGLERVFPVYDEEYLDALNAGVYAFLLAIPVGLIQRVLGGLQKTYVANNLSLLGSLLSLLSIVVVTYADLGLSVLVVLYVLSPVVVMLIYTIYFFYKNSRYLVRERFDLKEYIPQILSTGGWTVLVQIIYTAKMNLPLIIVSSALLTSVVAQYSVAQKVVGMIVTLISVALQPLWVVYGEAFAKGDYDWIKSRLHQSLFVTFMLSVCGALVLCLWGDVLISWWLGGDVVPSSDMIYLFSLWAVLASMNVSLAMFLNGTNHFRLQGLFSVVLISIALFVSYWSAPVYGALGVIASMAIIGEAIRLPLFYLYSRAVLRRGMLDFN